MLDFIYSYISIQTLAWLIVAFPLIGAVVNGAIALGTMHVKGEGWRPVVSGVAVAVMLASFVATCICFATLAGFEGVSPALITGPLFQWAVTPRVIIDIGLNLDQLSLVMALVITGVGSLIHVYSAGYMSHDEGFARYFMWLNLFVFFMLLLVLADNLVLLFFGWEGVGLCSYGLIGFWFSDTEKAQAGLKAFIVNRIGDAGFLLGIFLIFGVMAAASVDPAAGYFNFTTMSQYSAYFAPVATIVCLLLFVGACGKSAQIPLYVWLPDAMAGPTPVSALIHAATMVTAGVYMVVRLNFLYVLSPIAMETVAIVGAATALFAASMGLVARDIKKVLAYSTVSQLGYMFLACGVGAFSTAVFHLVTHAFFKALLFLGAGSVIHGMHGEQDIFKMGGLRHRMPITCWTFVIGSTALAGIIPTAGFFSKDAILWQTYASGHFWLWMVGTVSAAMTAFYIFRTVGAVFFGPTTLTPDQWKKAHESPMSMLLPLMLLATLSLAGGWLGVPEVLGGSDHIIAWLSDLIPTHVTHAHGASHSTEVVLMVVATLIAVHFSVLAWIVYAQKRELPQDVARRMGALYRLVAQRYYIDELYNAAIVRPLMWLSRVVLWRGVDASGIDGIGVMGTARAVGVWSRVLHMAQNGVVQQYLLYFLIGAVLIVGFVVM